MLLLLYAIAAAAAAPYDNNPSLNLSSHYTTLHYTLHLFDIKSVHTFQSNIS
jgi:hypothetical protein